MFGELQRFTVQAKPHPRWPGAIVKNVPQVGVTSGTVDFSSNHAKTVIRDFEHIFLTDRLKEAGPASAGVELRDGRKEGETTADTGVYPFFLVLQKVAAEGTLRA